MHLHPLAEGTRAGKGDQRPDVAWGYLEDRRCGKAGSDQTSQQRTGRSQGQALFPLPQLRAERSKQLSVSPHLWGQPIEADWWEEMFPVI